MKTLLSFLAIILLLSACKKEDDEPITPGSTDGLIASYDLNGDFVDKIGAFNGTVNGAIPTQDRAGNMESAYQFDGENDYVGLPNFIPTSKGTIRYWYKTTNNRTPQVLLYTTNSTSDDGFGSVHDVIEFHTGIQELDASHFYIYDNGKGSNAVSSINDDGNDPENKIEENRWYSFALAYDISDKFTLYLDGVKILEKDVSAKVFANHMPTLTQIGKPIADKRYFQGSIDDIRIYDKVLSATEIMEAYSSEK